MESCDEETAASTANPGLPGFIILCAPHMRDLKPWVPGLMGEPRESTFGRSERDWKQGVFCCLVNVLIKKLKVSSQRTCL